ncbi:Chloroperoxidase [Boletus edulis BED1]|uniref:Chloroperoxidase n=1 Tax=Boletus edulis BED1 TaxID=1328754 RepID=A0AAD4G5U7_BOLED|nr:Chloroperoxidase [Boletus edulis BED1]
MMKLQNLATLVALVPYALGFPRLENFPEYRSLAGLSPREVRAVARTFSSTPGAQSLPPPISDTSAKVVYDSEHPYIPDQPGDIRGPCPGLNTLASHGYLPRNGVATPAQIITAVQEGFNMGWNVASLVTYMTFIVDGNHLTNLMSIGANTTADDEPTPGLNIHFNVEGDASTTRGDFYFGNNYSFNETLFDQLEEAANRVGNGFITIESASLHRALRINDSITRNPTFWFGSPRFVAAYLETTVPLAFFVNNQTLDTTLNLTLDVARDFYEKHRFPEGFVRRQGPFDVAEVEFMFAKIFPLINVPPGHNEGVGNYVVNPEDDGSSCYVYHRQVNLTAQLYPNPTPELEVAIKANLVTFYQTLHNSSCEQYFPYGQ